MGLYGPYEILFRDASTKLHNGIQMFFNIVRVNHYARSTDDVIFDRSPVEIEADGIRPVHNAYHDEVDAIFKEIYRKGRFYVLPENNSPLLVELWGHRQQRLDQVQAAIDDLKSWGTATP